MIRAMTARAGLQWSADDVNTGRCMEVVLMWGIKLLDLALYISHNPP